MARFKLAICLTVVSLVALVLPVSVALADTALNTELLVNGGAESGTLENPIPSWTDNMDGNRWSSYYHDSTDTWAAPTEGTRYFFLYNAYPVGSGTVFTNYTMSQAVAIVCPEGGALYNSITSQNVMLRFGISMCQNLTTGNEAKAIVEQYTSGDVLIKTTQVLNTAVTGTVMGTYSFDTPLAPDARKIKVTLSATLTETGYAQFDAVSVKLVEAPAGSAPVFSGDFPVSDSTNAGVPYSCNFTISDADAGDVNNLTFSVTSTNASLVPATNVTVGGSGGNRTLGITPAGNLSGTADITITACDGIRSSSKTLRLTVNRVVAMDTNLVENGNGTCGTAGWSGYYLSYISATGNGFSMTASYVSMNQDIDISKYASLIDGGLTNFRLSASFPNAYGQVGIQFYKDASCTSPTGSFYTVSSGATSLRQTIPSDARGVTVTMSNTSSGSNYVLVQNIDLQIVNDFPKIASIPAQTARYATLTVPVNAYYTTTSATLTAVSSDQTIVPDGGITTGGSGFDRSVAFAPLKDGTVTITLTINDGSKTADTAFSVTVYELATITAVDSPASGYYATGGDLDFTVHFSRDVTGGTGSTLPLTVGGAPVSAAYLSGTSGSITYRYTLATGDEGVVALGTAVADAGTSIIDTNGIAAELSFTAAATGVTAVAAPVVTSTATGDSTTYGTRVTFTATLTCPDVLSGTVQFQSGGVAIGSPVTLGGNTASYEAEANAFDAGAASVTAVYVPGGTGYYFTSLTGDAYALNVDRKSVSVNGFVATNRDYDGTTDVALSGGTLTGVLDGDSVSLSCPSTGTAASQNVGTRNVSFTAITLTGTDKDNYTLSAQPTVDVALSPKTISFTAGVSAKVYDGSSDAVVSSVVFNALVSGDSLVSGTDYTANGVFDSAGVGGNVTAVVTVTLTGTANAANYTLSSATASATADITRRPVSVTGLEATGRAYDGTTDVALTGGALSGVLAGESVSVVCPTVGTASRKDAGTWSVSFPTIVLTGADVDNYILSAQPSVNVVISPKMLTASAGVADKVYDGGTAAAVTYVSFSGLITGESLDSSTDYTATGAFHSADVGGNVPATVTLSLCATATAGNYALFSATVDTTANITQNSVSITGVAAVNRAYDGTVSVSLTGGVLSGINASDVASVGFDLKTGAVADAGAGDAKPVTTGIILTGSKAGNYTLAQPSGITVDIARAPLVPTGATAATKIYDSTTDAVVTSVVLSGLASGETLDLGVDYTAVGVFASTDAGSSVAVTVSVTLAGTAKALNYTVSGTVGTMADITPETLAGTVSINVINATGDPGLVDQGDVLTLDTSGVTVHGTLTADCQWNRNATAVMGATAVTHIVGDLATDPVNTSFTVAITGTGNYRGTLTSTAVKVYSLPLGGSVRIAGTPSLGNTMTLDASSITPAGATLTIVWLRDGAAIAGANGVHYVIVHEDQGKTLTVEVTANGYYSGTLRDSLAVPLKSPSVPDLCIVELADRVTVDLTLDSTMISTSQLNSLLSLNATKPIVMSGNGYTLTFPTGSLLSGGCDLDMGVTLNGGTDYAIIRTDAGNGFVMMLSFNHCGALPGQMLIRIDVGVAYAGQTLQYSYFNPLTGQLEPLQTAVVDGYGFISFTQDHCSSYAVAYPVYVPPTGDGSVTLVWWLLGGFSAACLLALLLPRRRREKKAHP